MPVKRGVDLDDGAAATGFLSLTPLGSSCGFADDDCPASLDDSREDTEGDMTLEPSDGAEDALAPPRSLVLPSTRTGQFGLGMPALHPSF